jgi:hypothetical protein
VERHRFPALRRQFKAFLSHHAARLVAELPETNEKSSELLVFAPIALVPDEVAFRGGPDEPAALRVSIASALAPLALFAIFSRTP